MDFRLKDWSFDYAESIAINANNKKVSNNLRDVFPYPYTMKDADYFIEDCIKNKYNNNINKAIVVDDKAVGSIGITLLNDVYRKSAEIGYWLGENYWNKGIVTEAVKIIVKEAFERFDIVRINAEIFSDNVSSKRVLEKAGFKFEGVKEKSIYKNGVLKDSLLYAYIK